MNEPKHGQWIKGSWFSAKSFYDSKTNLIKSGLMKTEDFIMQGYKPEQKESGILYSWHNMPIAYYDIPTLNDMIFSKKLWNDIHENPFVKASLKNNAFYGEDCHRDSSEVLLENLTIRINDWWEGPDNMILADVQLLDTPKGLIAYSVAKTGMLGTSSRGFGDLIDIATGHVVDKMHPATGTTRVDEDSYLAVSQDVVCFPAVPRAFCLSTNNDDNSLMQSGIGCLNDLEKGLREQITSAIMEGHEKEPDNPWFNFMFNSLNLQDKKEKVFPLASSINFKNRYPKANDVKKLFK